MQVPATPQSPADQMTPARGWQIVLAFVVLAVGCIVGYTLDDGTRRFVFGGVAVLPFAMLAFLAYLGIGRGWARVITVIGLLTLLLVAALIGLSTSFGVLLVTATPSANPIAGIARSDWVKVAMVAVGNGIALLIGLSMFIPGVRRALGRLLPISPDSFTHTVAAVVVVSLTLVAFIPLAVLGEPPILTLIANDAMDSSTPTADLLDQIYQLIWLIPGTIVAVGFGVRRNLRQALDRLALVRPTMRQVVAALGLAVALVALVTVMELGIDAVWRAMGWPRTDSEAFEKLLAFAFTPIGAIVIGITAGLGEELAVRGVLQPRLGIVVSNLFFTSLHAFQYNWDSLLVVFIIGTALGLIRQRTNTTTSAIVHGTYDFLLVMAVVLQIPLLSE